ncbi:hypothetical protein BKA65DRAFT_480185 [Rhexocercosporidium sp. MPI-PUGE-AT-0058]|nr:hypothetical protein BKA65DRAFT_480185 [Rhexocercosporidium sp. MPI-PUGE-AT-0058]
MSESNTEARLDQDQVEDAPQGQGILLGFCYHPDQDNEAQHLVFGTLDTKGQLIPVIRHGIWTGNHFQMLYPDMNKKIDFSCITFEKHLMCLKGDIEALTEYCRICIRQIDQNKPLSPLEAVKQAIIAVAAKILGWKLSSARPYTGSQQERKFQICGPLNVPVATNDDLKIWQDFFRGKGWTEANIKEAGYAMDPSAYVKLPVE